MVAVGLPRRSRRPEHSRAQSHIQAVVGFPRRRGSLATPCQEARQPRSSSHYTTPERREQARVADLLLPSETDRWMRCHRRKNGIGCADAFGYRKGQPLDTLPTHRYQRRHVLVGPEAHAATLEAPLLSSEGPPGPHCSPPNGYPVWTYKGTAALGTTPTK